MPIESTSHDEINTKLLNQLTALTAEVERLSDNVKKNSDAVNASTATSVSLKATVTETNKVFEKVSDGITDLKNKVQQIEIVAKLWKQFGPAILQGFGGGLGGLGGQKKP